MITSESLIEHYFSVLSPLFTDPDITDICVNQFDSIWIDKPGGLSKTSLSFGSDEQLQNAITVLGNSLDQPFNEDHPILDARLPDGARISASHRSISPRGTCFTIRLHRGATLTAEDLVEYGTLTPQMLTYLRNAVEGAENILISGSTGSGKTTILNVLSSFIPKTDRVLLVEDTAELRIDVLCMVPLESPSRRKRAEGTVVDFARLIRHTLRNRPDRIIVGEIRDGAAAAAFLRAMTTGHTGTCSTLHANNCRNALNTLVNLSSETMRNIPYDVIREFAIESLDLLVHMGRTRDGRKVMTEIMEVEGGALKAIVHYDEANRQHDFIE